MFSNPCGTPCTLYDGNLPYWYTKILLFVIVEKKKKQTYLFLPEQIERINAYVVGTNNNNARARLEMVLPSVYADVTGQIAGEDKEETNARRLYYTVNEERITISLINFKSHGESSTHVGRATGVATGRVIKMTIIFNFFFF